MDGYALDWSDIWGSTTPRGDVVVDSVLVPGACGLATPQWHHVSSSMQRSGYPLRPERYRVRRRQFGSVTGS